MTPLTDLYAPLDAFNATMNDETDDSPQMLAEQERLFALIAHAEAADLTALSATQLASHYAARTNGKEMPKGMSKAAMIARIEQLPPLPAPAPIVVAGASAGPTLEFSVAGWARSNGKDAREVRKALRRLGKRAPYSMTDVQQLEKMEQL
jgi:hypothetical protein